LTAEDFIRSWQLALSPDSSAVTAGLMQDIVNATDIMQGIRPASELGVKVLDNGDLEVRLNRAAPWILEILAHPVSYPLYPGQAGHIQEEPVNGAYVLDEWVPRSVIRLRRNPNFHSSADVRTELVSYFPIEEPTTELARYRAGELDITETIPA
jgi:oligopeptide transport system substrate-binding protein